MPKDKIIAFLLRNPTYFIESISYYYPFIKAELQKYKDKVSWRLISWNLNIDWTYDLISEFQEQIRWMGFTRNANAFKDISLIDFFSDRINWNSSDISRHYSIALNEGIRWNKETIEKYASKINFEALSANTNVDWFEELLDKYLYKWDFIELGRNESVPWTIELFEKYLNIDYLNKDYQFDANYVFESLIVLNRTLVNFDLIEKYKDLLDWDSICRNEYLPWKEKNLLELWSENIKWSCIAENEFFFLDDKNFYHKNYDKWQTDKQSCICSFCGNKAFPWTKALIEIHKDSIDWNRLCANEGIEWNIDLINHFSEYIEWGGIFPVYEYNPLERETVLIEGIQEQKSGLIDNQLIPWSIDLLEYFETKLTPELMWKNKAIWEKAFKPYVDEKLIETIFKIMKTQKTTD